MTVSKVLNWIKWFIGALIVGGLGNGVWEKFLSPFISFTSDLIIKNLIELSTKFSDKIYSNAADSVMSNYNSESSAIGIILLLLTIAALIFSIFWRNKTEKYKLDAFDYKFFTFTFIAFFAMVSITYASDRYIQRINLFSNKNLEIVRPYIGEFKYFQLRSNYLRITTKKEFDSYEDEVNKYSKENNLNLKKFSD